MLRVYKAYAKVNIFLKITGTRDNYHEIVSRFMRVGSLYDEISFLLKSSKEFKIIGDFACETEQNTIYKAYLALRDYIESDELDLLMERYAICVKKSIPAFAGLGGGSSDAATYLKMCNKVLDLGLSLEELATVGLKVGADVPFFIYGYSSANVSGIGEIVEKFDEKVLDFEIYTPDVEISTPKVYKSYRENFFNPIDSSTADKLKKTSSLDILNSMKIDEVNDLYNPAKLEYKELEKSHKDGYYFSGSGSSFFRVKTEERTDG